MAKFNELLCFRPDSSLDVLIVAPTLSFNNASGGGSGYNKLPKAALDRSGDYIVWSSNLRSDRIDYFVAKVPWHLLVAEEDYNPSSPSSPSSTSPQATQAPGANTPTTSGAPSQNPTQAPTKPTLSEGSETRRDVLVIVSLAVGIIFL